MGWEGLVAPDEVDRDTRALSSAANSSSTSAAEVLPLNPDKT